MRDANNYTDQPVFSVETTQKTYKIMLLEVAFSVSNRESKIRKL